MMHFVIFMTHQKLGLDLQGDCRLIDWNHWAMVRSGEMLEVVDFGYCSPGSLKRRSLFCDNLSVCYAGVSVAFVELLCPVKFIMNLIVDESTRPC